jgi:VanZ family protein
MGGRQEHCGQRDAGGNKSRQPVPLRIVNRLLCAYLLLILWNSFFPFEADFDSVPSLPGALLPDLPTGEVSYGDVVSNIAAYVPLGALLALYVWFKSGRLLAGMLASVALCSGLSFCVEVLQQFEVTRISSISDLVCNAAGAVLGSCCAPLIFMTIRQARRRWARELHISPLASLARLYAGALLVVALIPWSFTVDKRLVLEHHRAAKVCMARVVGAVIPWAEYTDYTAYEGVAEWRREAMETVMAGIYELLTFAILAVLVSRVLESDLGFKPLPRVLLTFYLVGLWATLMVVLQLFVRFGTGNYLMYGARLLGCVLGVTAYQRVPLEWVRRNIVGCWPSSGLRISSWLRFLLVPCALFIVLFMGWVPFFFSMEGTRPVAVNAPVFLPFHQYFQAQTAIAYQDFFFK